MQTQGHVSDSDNAPESSAAGLARTSSEDPPSNQRSPTIDLTGPSNSESEANASVPTVPIISSFIINNQGAFAVSDIPQGSRILNEVPLIKLCLGNFASVDAIMEQFDRLPKDQQEFIWSFNEPNRVEQLDKLAHLTDSLILSCDDFLAKPVEQWTSEEQDHFNVVGPTILRLATAWRISARYYSECFSLEDLRVALRDNLPPDTPITGLFPQASRLRHSCVPNCYGAWNLNTGCFTIHTTKNIRTGEELFVSVLGRDNWYNVAQYRVSMLKESPALWCNCEACAAYHPNFSMHEQARAKLHVTSAWIDRYISDVNYYMNPPCEFGQHVPEPPSPEDLQDAQDACLRNLQLLRETGCENTELVCWRNVLVDKVFPFMEGKEMAALAQATMAEKIMLRCYGADHPEVDDARERLAWVKAWVEKMKQEASKGKGKAKA